MSALSSADRLPALKVAISASVSLVVMIIDFVWLLRDEVKFVWPRIRCSWYARCYMLSRYTGLASQIFNVFFTFRMYSGIRTSSAGCKIWFVYQAIMVQFLLAFAEGLVMHRLYSLFLRSRIILWILIFLAVGQVSSMGISARFTFPSIRHMDTCIILSSPPGNAYFGLTTMVTNVLIFFMTFFRYLRLPAGWTKQGLGWVVIRDSVLSVLAICAVTLFLTLCALKVIRPSISGNVTYYWLVCVLWVSIGRIVINHEKLPREIKDGGSTWKSAIQVTTLIELGEISQTSLTLTDDTRSSKNASSSRGTPQSFVCASDTSLGRPIVVEPSPAAQDEALESDLSSPV